MSKADFHNRLNKMLDDVIHKYGFEHPVTIRFAQCMETVWDKSPAIWFGVMLNLYRTIISWAI